MKVKTVVRMAAIFGHQTAVNQTDGKPSHLPILRKGELWNATAFTLRTNTKVKSADHQLIAIQG